MDYRIVRFSEFARQDLIEGRRFYEEQSPDLGTHFFDSLLADIDSLHWFAGIHSREFRTYRVLAKRFPYSIYYLLDENEVLIVAILDQRRSPLYHYMMLENRTHP